jgi:hypothetical protein
MTRSREIDAGNSAAMGAPMSADGVSAVRAPSAGKVEGRAKGAEHGGNT